MAQSGDAVAPEGLSVVLAIAGRGVVVIAAGERGVAEATALAGAGASVTLVGVTPLPADAVDARALPGSIEVLGRPYVRGDLAGAFAAVCFETGEAAAAIASEASSVSCLVHVDGRPDLSSFRFAHDAMSAPSEEIR